jgi:hypothetical protein
MSHDGKYGITVNNGDETVSIIDTAKNEVAATLEGPKDMTGVNFAGGKAWVIGSTTGFLYSYDMRTLRRPAASRSARTSSFRRRPPILPMRRCISRVRPTTRLYRRWPHLGR